MASGNRRGSAKPTGNGAEVYAIVRLGRGSLRMSERCVRTTGWRLVGGGLDRRSSRRGKCQQEPPRRAAQAFLYTGTVARYNADRMISAPPGGRDAYPDPGDS